MSFGRLLTNRLPHDLTNTKPNKKTNPTRVWVWGGWRVKPQQTPNCRGENNSPLPAARFSLPLLPSSALPAPLRRAMLLPKGEYPSFCPLIKGNHHTPPNQPHHHPPKFPQTNDVFFFFCFRFWTSSFNIFHGGNCRDHKSNPLTPDTHVSPHFNPPFQDRSSSVTHRRRGTPIHPNTPNTKPTPFLTFSGPKHPRFAKVCSASPRGFRPNPIIV